MINRRNMMGSIALSVAAVSLAAGAEERGHADLAQKLRATVSAKEAAYSVYVDLVDALEAVETKPDVLAKTEDDERLGIPGTFHWANRDGYDGYFEARDIENMRKGRFIPIYDFLTPDADKRELQDGPGFKARRAARAEELMQAFAAHEAAIAASGAREAKAAAERRYEELKQSADEIAWEIAELQEPSLATLCLKFEALAHASFVSLEDMASDRHKIYFCADGDLGESLYRSIACDVLALQASNSGEATHRSMAA